MTSIVFDITTQNVAEIKQEIKQLTRKQNSAYGLLIALGLIGLWAISLILLLSIHLDQFPVWLIPPAILWQMFLYTGLFITAHDAMHGAVYLQSAKVNHFLGALAVTCYGLFSYRELLEKHWLHHRYPASDQDPDFHDGEHNHPVRWYFYFISRYWKWKQLIGLTLVYILLHQILHVPQNNLTLFWVAPSVLSSVQLFYFGTFLTHNEPSEGFKNSHRARTNPLPIFWSFITCYHFGYHEEHHEHPSVAWWQLPTVHRLHRSC